MKITKKNLIEKLNRMTVNNSPLSEDLKTAMMERTFEEMKARRLYLKDMKKINYFVCRTAEIQFHTKDSYFCCDLGRVRIK
jgi:hypothetical protein